MNIKLKYYFKVQLKSTDKCPKFYSPSLNETTTFADGGQLITFGDSNEDDKRPRPNGIYIPPQPIEECPPTCFVNFNKKNIADGNPQVLTNKQYDVVVAKLKAMDDPDAKEEHADA